MDCMAERRRLTGPPPINVDFRNDAIGGSASNALFCCSFGLSVTLDEKWLCHIAIELPCHHCTNIDRIDPVWRWNDASAVKETTANCIEPINCHECAAQNWAFRTKWLMGREIAIAMSFAGFKGRSRKYACFPNPAEDAAVMMASKCLQRPRSSASVNVSGS